MPLLNGANEWSGAQTFKGTSVDVAVEVDGDAGFNRALAFYTTGSLRWYLAANSTAETGSNAGSDLALYRYSDAGTFLGTALQIRRSDGSIVVGSPAGSFKGAGTINAQAVYDDNVLLTCYILEAATAGQVNQAKWDALTPNRKTEGKAEEVRTHAPAMRFAARAEMMLDPKQYADFWRTNGHLPSMPSPAEWAAADHKLSTGDLIQRLWEVVEVQSVHLEKLRQRIEALEGGSPA